MVMGAIVGGGQFFAIRQTKLRKENLDDVFLIGG
jgi:hypothetical protein